MVTLKFVGYNKITTTQLIGILLHKIIVSNHILNISILVITMMVV